MQGSLERVEYEIEELDHCDDNNKYKIRIKVPMDYGWIDDARFYTEKDGGRDEYPLHHVKNEDGYAIFEEDVTLSTSAVYRYYFSFFANGDFKFFKKKNITEDKSIWNDEKWKMSVNFDTPDWAKGKVMYHIFVDRFCRKNTLREKLTGKTELEPMERRTIHKEWDEMPLIGPDENGIWNADFYGGNLKGIISKLNYIKSLGVSILYLSPVVESQSNHRYDTADYENVDPYAGCNEDLRKLCNEAHRRGMKVVLDSVFNHTGNDSKYFNEFGKYKELGAFQSKDSKYYDFYRKHYDNGNIYFDHWWGMPNLPVCDGYSKKWQEYIYGAGGVIDKWFALGIDGLRLDVADELSDEFIEGIRRAVKRNKPDGLILGEVWKNPMRMNRGYISSGRGMDSVMNYQLADAMIRYFKYEDEWKLRDIIREIESEYPKGTIETLMNFTSTHDISRAINIFALPNEFNGYSEWAWNLNNGDLEYCKNRRLTKEEYERGKELYKACMYALTFMPGILSIFYGDEAGIEGMGNLANRKPFPWEKKDEDLVNFFKEMGRIRKKEKFLETADLNIYDINNKYMMFERENDGEKALVTVNRSSEPIVTPIPKEYERAKPEYALNDSDIFSINSHGGLVLKKRM